SFMQTSLPEAGNCCLGKIRQEMPGEIIGSGQGGRGLARELAEIADQMGLIVVAAGDGGSRPGRAALNDGKDALHTADTGVELGRKSDAIGKTPLQLARADTESISERCDIARAMGLDQCAERLHNHRVGRSSGELQKAEFEIRYSFNISEEV